MGMTGDPSSLHLLGSSCAFRPMGAGRYCNQAVGIVEVVGVLVALLHVPFSRSAGVGVAERYHVVYAQPAGVGEDHLV